MWVVVFCVCLFNFPSDDGLRHVGLGFAGLKSWGEVYPFSYFEIFKDYDPWFGYDLALKTIASGFMYFPFSPLFSQFLLTKILFLLFLTAFLYLALKRSGILADIVDQETFSLTFIILLALLVQPLLRRISTIRPFVFGILFLIYTVGQKGVLKGFLSSAVLVFFYPYLAWFHTIPVSVAHFFRGDKRFALGVLSFTMIFLCLQPPYFWGFQMALFQSDIVRGMIDPKIGELSPSFKSVYFYSYLAAGFLFYPLFSREARKLNYPNLLIIIYLLPSLKYIRYLLDFILPLLFVSFGREMLTVLLEPYRKVISYWENAVLNVLQKLKLPQIESNSGKTSSTNLKPYIALAYAIVLILVIHLNQKEFSSFKGLQADLSAIPAGSLVLTDFDLQYKTLYVRPDLHIIPSCEMGFPNDSIRKEYIAFLNEGKVLSLAHKTRAQFFLEFKHMYVNPQEGAFLQLVKETDGLKVWRILH